jgi:hypothetical protein
MKAVSNACVGRLTDNPWLLSACLSITIGAGCGSPRLIDYKPTHSDAEYRQQIFSSPIVVVGVIESDTLVDNRVPSHWDRRTLLQFRKLKIRVENVLRGDSVPPLPRSTTSLGLAGSTARDRLDFGRRKAVPSR